MPARVRQDQQLRPIAAGLACLAALAFVAGYVHAAPAPLQDHCCVPAHAADPTTPPPGSDNCKVVVGGNGNCQDLRSGCTGQAWQDAIAGSCPDKPTKTCTPPSNPPTVVATVTVNSGHWTCIQTAPQNGKCCIWVQDVPLQQTTASVGNCTGDGC